MTINNQIQALTIKNTMVKPVNMAEFNNPFLLLSSTKALNELVVNTNPSSRAKVANIEPTKSKFQQNPLGVPIDVYTKDTPTTPQVPKLKGSARLERTRATLKSELATRVAAQKKRREERQKPKPKAKPSPLPVVAPKPANKVPPKRGPGRPKSDKKPSEGDKPKRPVGRPKNLNPKPVKPKRPVGRPKKSTVVAPKQRAGGGSYETGGLGGF